jgi:quercetin dioxygenase-like cupin family protein
VFGVGLSYFFREAEEHSLSITRREHLQETFRNGTTDQSIPLGIPVGQNDRLSAEMVEIASGTRTALSTSGGGVCAFIYVLEGRLKLIAGNVTDALDPGDCVYVNTSMPLAWSVAEKQRCRILLVRAN